LAGSRLPLRAVPILAIMLQPRHAEATATSAWAYPDKSGQV